MATTSRTVEQIVRFLLMLTALALSSPAAGQSTLPIVRNFPDRPAELIFADGARYQTRIHRAKVLGSLPTQRKSAYLILSGYGCIDCDAEISLYLVSVSDGPMRPEATQPVYGFPGKVSDWDTEEIVFESRVFFGQCLSTTEAAILWRQRTREAAGTWRRSLFMVTIDSDDGLREQRADDSDAVAALIADRVAAGRCREIPPHHRTASP